MIKDARPQPGGALHRLLGLRLGADLEARLQLECRGQLPLPRHHVHRHPRAHPGRSVPPGDLGAERLQRRPAHPGPQQARPVPQLHDHLQQPGQSQPGAGSGAHLYGGRGLDTGLHSRPDHVAGLFPHPSGQRDRVDRAQHHHPVVVRGFGRHLDLLQQLSASLAVQRSHARQPDVEDLTFNLNTASVSTEGWDFEANYGWDMADIISDWKGS